MICEICVIICNSVKLKPLQFSKINMNDFNMNFLKTKMKADRSNYIMDKLKYGDPSEMKIILNEFNYCLITKNYELCNYWLSWAFEFEKKNTKKNKDYICGYREIEEIDQKYKNDICWIIWEILIKESLNMEKNITENIQSLYKLYKYNFKKSGKGKKNIYFLNAIKYFTDIYGFSKNIIPDYSVLIQACSNINYLFIEKINNSYNKTKLSIDKKSYNKNVIEINNKQKSVNDKKILKKMKEIANENVRLKITTVEQIDRLILNNKI